MNEPETISQDEFVRRFVVEMVRLAGKTFDDGTSIEEYAAFTAHTYWAERGYLADAPEECAAVDIGYWGD